MRPVKLEHIAVAAFGVGGSTGVVIVALDELGQGWVKSISNTTESEWVSEWESLGSPGSEPPDPEPKAP
jgi:hypothetical protein